MGSGASILGMFMDQQAGRRDFARKQAEDRAAAEWLAAAQASPDLATFQTRLNGVNGVVQDPIRAAQLQQFAIQGRKDLAGLKTFEQAQKDQVTLDDFLKKVDASGLALPSEMPNTYGQRPTLPEFTKDLTMFAADQGVPTSIALQAAEKMKGATRDVGLKEFNNVPYVTDTDSTQLSVAPGYIPPAPKVKKETITNGSTVSDVLMDDQGNILKVLGTGARWQPNQGGGRPAAPSGYRWTADGRQEPIPGGPADKGHEGRALPIKAVNDLTRQTATADNSQRFNQTFQDNFGGHTLLGNTSNTIGRIVGDDSGQAQWWQDYALHEAQVRNDLFGSALTGTELGSWQKITISPRMSPKEIRKNLTRRAQIEEKALQKLVRSYTAAGYNPQQIEELTGRRVTAQTQQPKTQQPKTQTNDLQSAARAELARRQGKR